MKFRTKSKWVAYLCSTFIISAAIGHAAEKKKNVLFIIADDLTANALSCYENKACKTPNIDQLASEGIRYTKAYCQFPVCGPSRASFMSGYYPVASKAFGYVSGRKQIGNRLTWTQYFKNHGYHTARVSKIFHMGVPIDIYQGTDGSDDKLSWNERYNVKAKEMYMKGEGEMLEGNPNNTKKVKLGNYLQYVKGGEDDLLYADGLCAKQACELLEGYKKDLNKPFFLAIGFVRPHVPFVAPQSYHDAYPVDKIEMPKKVAGDHDDIPARGMGQFISKQRHVSPLKEKKAVSSYYAAVSHMDAQVGKVLETLKKQGLEDDTIVIFTSDHGYHIGEHNFWMKISVHEESARVPLIIKVPGKKPAVCSSLSELIDLYPTISEACGLKVPKNIQGKSLVRTFDNPAHKVRDAAYTATYYGSLLRTDNWAYLEYSSKRYEYKDDLGGAELYDMVNDPQQFTNLAKDPAYAHKLKEMKEKLANKLTTVRQSDIATERAQKNRKKPTRKN